MKALQGVAEEECEQFMSSRFHHILQHQVGKRKVQIEGLNKQQHPAKARVVRSSDALLPWQLLSSSTQEQQPALTLPQKCGGGVGCTSRKAPCAEERHSIGAVVGVPQSPGREHSGPPPTVRRVLQPQSIERRGGHHSSGEAQYLRGLTEGARRGGGARLFARPRWVILLLSVGHC